MDTLPLQSYMRGKLGSYAPLQAIVGQNIFDQPPPNQVFPYVVLGATEATDMTLVDCLIDWEVIAQLDVYSRSIGFPETKRIADACDEALAERHPTITGLRVGWFEVHTHRFLREPDGITSHGVLSYRARYGPES